jgi:hypothetical protein
MAAENEITSTKPELTANELVVHDSGQFATLFDTARFNQGWRVAQAFASSKMVPVHFQGNTAGVFVVLHMATRMELDPFMVLQNMYMVHGKPGMETKLALALVNTRGPFTNPIAWEFDNEENPKKCTAFGFLKTTGERRSYTLEWDTVVKEKWLDKDGSKWKTLPKLMFMYRSAIFLIRTVCPEVILGLSTFDELQDINGEVVDVTPTEVTAKLIPQTEKIKEKLKRGRKLASPEPAQEAIEGEPLVTPSPEPENVATETSRVQEGNEGPSMVSLVEKLAGLDWPIPKLQIKFGKPMAEWGEKEISLMADMVAES